MIEKLMLITNNEYRMMTWWSKYERANAPDNNSKKKQTHKNEKGFFVFFKLNLLRTDDRAKHVTGSVDWNNESDLIHRSIDSDLKIQQSWTGKGANDADAQVN